MNYKYYKSSSDIKEELFGISQRDKIFIMDQKQRILTVQLNKNVTKRMKLIEEYQYIFSKEIREYIIENIKKYINYADLKYRRKTLRQLLDDIKELEEM